ncbi:MAG: serine/threonine phosphoprotein phosphatase [Clostridiales bacterium]|jgi:hypothetical protein|nr:serine/threonine phosphoprotein phosphatase [Clostridiales bacterium]
MDGPGLNSAMSWVYSFCSTSGTSHIKAGRTCQDSCTCEVINSKDGEEILIAIASDGAGSARYGDVGSRLICNIIKEEIISFLEKGFHIKDVRRETAAGWIEKFREEVVNITVDNGRTLRDYACTLVGAVVGLYEEVYFQIGDGAIVVLPRYYPGRYKCIFWPQRGEYENTTFFATDMDAVNKQLMFKMGESEGDEIINIAVFTDGIQQLALHYESQTPFAKFFMPLFKALDFLKKRDNKEINPLLEVFLGSEKINTRTDDDKTLIIAARF